MKTIFKKLLALSLLVVFLLGALTACKIPNKKVNYVTLTIKDMGDIVIQLDRESAPKTVENFVNLVQSGFYDGLTFHRVIEGFMIQGGDPKGNGSGSSDTKIEGEFSANGFFNPIRHQRGVISMARSNAFNSASCQFFICVDSAPSLDGFYAAFGYVVEGMDIVDAIVNNTAHLATDGNGGGIPKESRAVIEKATAHKDYNP